MKEQDAEISGIYKNLYGADILDMSKYDMVVNMDDISMTRGESMGFQANGILPLGKNHVGKTPISLTSTLIASSGW